LYFPGWEFAHCPHPHPLAKQPSPTSAPAKDEDEDEDKDDEKDNAIADADAEAVDNAKAGVEAEAKADHSNPSPKSKKRKMSAMTTQPKGVVKDDTTWYHEGPAPENLNPKKRELLPVDPHEPMCIYIKKIVGDDGKILIVSFVLLLFPPLPTPTPT